MVATKVKTPLGFGSNVPRFGKIHYHPGLDPSGLFVTRPKGCNPCLYHPVPFYEYYLSKRRQKADKDPWRYKTELEDWSKNLGYRNQKILEQRRWFATLLGPAWTEVPEPTKYEPACNNLNFGRTPRFKSYSKSVPGPGTYFRGEPYKAPYGPHSTRPTLEREDPCRFRDPTPRWSLAPNRYTLVDKDSIENKPKKIVSLRGPYDLFTGKRFTTPKRVVCATWPIALPGCFEGYKKKHFGKWNKTGREVPPRNRNAMTDLANIPRKSTEPSPYSYNVVRPMFEFPQYKYGFNSSYDKAPGYQRTIVWPGVGRYNLAKGHPCGMPGHGHRHVFLSKIKRTIGAVIPEPLNSF
ncbi:uncharacterized protein LOC126379836 [Pectinophora gossypiella]|uniref:uncharacterized protein LOC126379836 n=1 Tax=Pectinophora gossypiella TaxID=13191 RepID=UPI00214EDEFC|nr:uncharacterized protein LOC126379836 [Pectinophora gossypiella]